MQYQEAYTEFDSGLLDLVLKKIPAAFAGTLMENGTALVIPRDRALELKVKYDVSEDGGAFSLKFTWDNDLEEFEEEEED
ncbi:MAG: transcription initiation factor IIE [Papillibacter sp.]|jgi:hypothetical protein|nr:transcription initiation factor IIE [Papillibacter sp.]